MLKKLLILVIFISYTSHTFAEVDKWMKLKSGVTYDYYVNPSFMFVINKNTKNVKFWVMSKVKTPQTKEGLTTGDSLHSLNFANCDTKEIAIKEIKVYKKSGQLFDKQSYPSLIYKDIEPDTIQDILVKTVCDDLFILRQ